MNNFEFELLSTSILSPLCFLVPKQETHFRIAIDWLHQLALLQFLSARLFQVHVRKLPQNLPESFVVEFCCFNVAKFLVYNLQVLLNKTSVLNFKLGQQYDQL